MGSQHALDYPQRDESLLGEEQCGRRCRQARPLVARVEQQAGRTTDFADTQRRGWPMTYVRSWQFWIIIALALATMACAGRRERREEAKEAGAERAEQKRAEGAERHDLLRAGPPALRGAALRHRARAEAGNRRQGVPELGSRHQANVRRRPAAGLQPERCRREARPLLAGVDQEVRESARGADHQRRGRALIRGWHPKLRTSSGTAGTSRPGTTS